MQARCLDAAAGGVFALVFAAVADAQSGAAAGALSSMPLPGGVRAAQVVVGDTTSPDRAQFLLDTIRRLHQLPPGPNAPKHGDLPNLVAHLASAAAKDDGASDPVPLPLPVSVWIDWVFAGRARVETLAERIVESRGAAFLYYGLFALDDDTRAWLAAQPALVAEIAARYGPAFVIAAPGIRVASGSAIVPGGAPAVGAWEALVGARVTQPAAFVRAVLSAQDGRLAYFLGSAAALSPEQQHAIFRLASPDAAVRVNAVRRLHAIASRVAADWRIDNRTFWRPALDPTLLLSDLPSDAAGAPLVYGSEGFWQMAFDSGLTVTPARRIASPQPADPLWLSERIFNDDVGLRPQRYRQVLFAARVVGPMPDARPADALEAVRAVTRFPALVATLERMRVDDLSVYAAAARRATHLAAIEDDEQALRSTAQFQGLITLIARAVARGRISPRDGTALLRSLCEVETNEHGDYQGRLVDWTIAHLSPAGGAVGTPVARGVDSDADAESFAPGALEDASVDFIAGAPGAPPLVEWEGTRYVVDLATTERGRLARLLGERPRPYLSAAAALAAAASTLERARVDRQEWDRLAQTLDAVAREVGLTEPEVWRGGRVQVRYRELRDTLGKAGSRGGLARGRHDAARLRTLAEDLLARGLAALVYAAALGQSERARVWADDTARTHDFGLRVNGVRRRDAPWRLPVSGGDSRHDWHAVGSLLGLDVRLAELSLVRLSLRPPPRKPTLNEEQRRTFVETVALVQPDARHDADRDEIARALDNGRAAWGAARTPAALRDLAERLRLDPMTRGLLTWRLAHDPESLSRVPGPADLLALGLDGRRPGPSLQAWGMPGESRNGCLCLQLVDRAPADMYAGRWGTGIAASTFPDLNLRLAELLAEMRMPAVLLGPVLGSAVLDFVNGAVSRDQDDRRGLLEFVRALSVARLEQYLALLTTDGPLMPSTAANEPVVTKTGVPR